MFFQKCQNLNFYIFGFFCWCYFGKWVVEFLVDRFEIFDKIIGEILSIWVNVIFSNYDVV